MSGATFAAAFLITEEFPFARGYSPMSTGVRLPFFATPMVVSPIAGAISDRVGRRPIMLFGLALQAIGYAWAAARGSLATSWVELVIALLVAGIGISMALPTVRPPFSTPFPSTKWAKRTAPTISDTALGCVGRFAAQLTPYGPLRIAMSVLLLRKH